MGDNYPTRIYLHKFEFNCSDVRINRNVLLWPQLKYVVDKILFLNLFNSRELFNYIFSHNIDKRVKVIVKKPMLICRKKYPHSVLKIIRTQLEFS